MSIPQISISNEPLKYKRLLAVDIIRIPDKKTQKHDMFCANPEEKTEEQIKQRKRKSTLQKIFTLATFGIAGLYIAHRNDCFKPIKRAVKNLLNNKEIQNEVRNFVNTTNALDHYPAFIKRYLTELSKSDEAGRLAKEEAIKIINTPDRLQNITIQIMKKAQKEKIDGKEITIGEYNDGIFAELMKKVKLTLETYLAKDKKNGIPYKNKAKKKFDSLFLPDNDGNKTIRDLLYEVASRRFLDTIDKYIDDAIIQTI